MRYSKDLKEYELLDMANGEKLEKWGEYILIRPDPQIICKYKTRPELWKEAHAQFIRGSNGTGHWKILKQMENAWKLKYKELIFNIKPMEFKHTGLFPEQAVNWDYVIDKISNKKNQGEDIRVLNLFAYTGGATIACAYAGASVCHVDSSQGMTNWAKENLASSALADKPVRFIVDDVVKFVNREIRRGNKYDIIIMDPPSYGRGKKGEVWDIQKDLAPLLKKCFEILSNSPICVLINTYTEGLSKIEVKKIVRETMGDKKVKSILSDEIGLKQKDTDNFLPCGITTICEF